MTTEERNPGGDPTGLIRSLEAQGPNSLLRAPVLGKLIRRFVGGQLRMLGAFKEGRVTRSFSISSGKADCGYYAAILAGTTPLAGYEVDPQWPASSLAAFLRQQLGDEVNADGDDVAVIADALENVLMAVYKVVKLPEAEQEAAIDKVIKCAVGLFGGVKA